MTGDTGEVSGSIFGCSKSNSCFAGGKHEGFSRVGMFAWAALKSMASYRHDVS